MKYLTFVFITLLFSCEDNKIGGNEYTIISLNKTEKHQIFDDVKPAKLTYEEIIEIEKIIQQRVTKTISDHNSELTEFYAKFPNKQFPSDLTEYYRQYIPGINSDGEKVVWINFFCGKPKTKSWKTNIISVRDGGNCYFNLKVNLSKKKYYDYRVNGIAGI